MLTPEDVFITDGYPLHTYVSFDAGQQEEELREGLDQKNKVISISGPSKSGKTTLCNKVFGTVKGVSRMYVTGDAIQKADDLWLEAYRQVTSDADEPFFNLSHGERIETLTARDMPLVIDDFHYIHRDVQSVLAKQIKNAASDGLRIICLSVPHRGDDPIRSNNDLCGRFFSVDFSFWNEKDLAEIALAGFPKVGFPSLEAFNFRLAREALKSPQIMQTLCLEACRSHGKDQPLENIVPSEEMMPEIIRRTVRSYDRSTALEMLRQGPPTRGTERTYKHRAANSMFTSV